MLEPGELLLPLARKRVTVRDYPDGRLEIQYNGIPLPYRTFDKLRSVNRAPVVENKRLSAILEMVAETQSSREVQRSKKAPARTGQSGQMFDIS